ncbi:tRNA-U20-dihydrouridine synthase [Keratinibaculum paraultunense]|uniref:tRNA-dihydrouridine synthase n=1 Tax=Keratinibaculum paraultunense TaxID=1278232 RepID=A0A4R3KSD7_9FIRM|nr:tRNA dihydrouridine synthase DusB [Keratinibaculum paraultunense]QQY79470.1 tRNA dihydrouridine synthase DusB [Keratinibaculum paraultunense]TCS88036.1 tRNA-U20-dihydrouridine synthase [Keratinibaculum paraultunense]
MEIGNVKLQNNIFLAPMAGVTDRAYRIICKEMGAGLVFTEMVSSKGLYYEDEKTKELTSIAEKERPVAIQIFGSDPSIMSEVVKKYINPRDDIDILDINMGCPAPKIVKNGDGAALLKNPSLIKKILKEVVKVSTKPVTIKIRIGWDINNINGMEIAKMAEAEGVSAITVHGRTRDMFYSGKANWEYIGKIKNYVNIPVIGNGDIFEPIDAINMMEYTGCDGVAIGRGAMGNPWIFKRINLLLKGKDDVNPSDIDRINMAIKHLDMVCDVKGEKIGVREMRKHIAWYLKGMRNSNKIKNTINTVETKQETEKILLDYAQYISNCEINQ